VDVASSPRATTRAMTRARLMISVQVAIGRALS
jgi:hypothetical protein